MSRLVDSRRPGDEELTGDAQRGMGAFDVGWPIKGGESYEWVRGWYMGWARAYVAGAFARAEENRDALAISMGKIDRPALPYPEDHAAAEAWGRGYREQRS